MQEIGKRLRSAREAKGLTLAQVEEALKIRKKYLSALEEGRIEELPAPVFARGFLRSYANYLGLGGEEMVERFKDWMKAAGKSEEPAVLHLLPTPLMGEDGSRGEVEDVLPSRRSRRGTTLSPGPGPLPSRKRIGRIGTAIALGLATAAILFGLLVWILIQQAIPKPPTVSQGRRPPRATVPGKVYRPAVTPRAQQVTVTALPGATPKAVAYQVRGVKSLDLTVAVSGTQPCWVGQLVNGTYVKGGVTIAPGQRQVFRAGQSLVVTFGKPNEAKLWINGKSLGVAGGTVVRTVTFQRA